MIRMTFRAAWAPLPVGGEFNAVVPHPESNRTNWAMTTSAIADLIILLPFAIRRSSLVEILAGNSAKGRNGTARRSFLFLPPPQRRANHAKLTNLLSKSQYD
jgi:hypothetical protein